MAKVFSILLVLVAFSCANAAIVRSAPDFSWPAAGNKNRSLRSLRGQSVVLLIADSPKNGKFRKQLKWLDEIYTSFAAKGVVFIAAFQKGEGPVQCNIPFVVANNGAAVANAYGVKDDGFSLVVIGRDGNVDYQTDRVRTGERVRDVIQNSYAVQAPARKD